MKKTQKKTQQALRRVAPIVFVLSDEQSDKLRRYVDETGASLDGLACSAVSMLMDVLEDDYGETWAPRENGMASAGDIQDFMRDEDREPHLQYVANILEGVVCMIAGRKTSVQDYAEVAVDSAADIENKGDK